MTIRLALERSAAAAVRTSDGRLLRMRLIVGWETPTLDGADSAGDWSVLRFAPTNAVLMRRGKRALRYRLQKRRDWWLMKQVDHDEPLFTLHPDRAIATREAEQELEAAVVAGGRHLPYGY